MKASNKEKIEVRVGVPLKENLVSPDGWVVLIGAGTIVTREMIQKLSNWIVEAPPDEPIKREKKAPVASNRETILKKLEFDQIVSEKTRKELEKGVNDFFGRIGNEERKLDISSLEDAVAKMVDETPDNPDVPMRLSELKRQAQAVYNHSIECGVMASFIGAALSYSQQDITAFSLSMMLHDVGYLTLPREIMEMKLEPAGDNLEQIKLHTSRGYEMLSNVPGIEPITLLIAAGHHVFADGSGYPGEIPFPELPTLAHLAVIINHFEMLISTRPYKIPLSMHDAIKNILANSNKFHPLALEQFVKVVGIFPISTFVTLNTNEVGVVVRNNPENLFLPEIKLVMDPAGKVYSKEIIVNLISEPSRHIVKVQDKV